MIIIFEQDLRCHDGVFFRWKPHFFRGTWATQKTYRIGWGLWSISLYRSPGLKDFFDHIGNTKWYGNSEQYRSERDEAPREINLLKGALDARLRQDREEEHGSV